MYPCYYSWMSSPHILIKPDIFEKNINKNLRCINGYTNYVAQNLLVNWVPKNSWKMSLSESPQAHEIVPCPRTYICNYYEQINVAGDIFNSGVNVEEQEDYGFTR